MSCNGCRVLRKGCSDSCVLRPCLQSIESPEAQGHATVFVAKFFGRAGLMSFISSVPDAHRPALFQSLLYEACGRTVNPVTGAVGLLWTGNWHVCQEAVDTVLRGGTLRAIPLNYGGPDAAGADLYASSSSLLLPWTVTAAQTPPPTSAAVGKRRRGAEISGLDLCLTAAAEEKRPASPPEESVTTSVESDLRPPALREQQQPSLLNLFV